MEARGRWRATLAALAIVAALAAAATGPAVVDDAWISWRYAEHLVAGHGLVYNAGEPPVEGYTNLAWTLVLACAAAVGIGPSAAMYALGIASAAAAAPGVAGLARALGAGPVASGLAGLALAASPHFAVVATNGIESASWVAAVCWAGVAVLTAPLPAAVLATAVLIVSRPEGAAIAVLWALGRAPGDRARLAVAWALAVAALTTWRIATYGRLVPNTWDAKLARGIGEQIAFDLGYLRPDAPFWAVLGLAFAAAAAPASRDARRRAAWLVAAFVVALAFRVDLWMPGGRLLQPAHAVALALFASLLEGTRLVAILAVWTAIVPLTPWGRHPLAYDARHTADPGNPAEIAGRWLGAHAPPGAWLATRDAGVLAGAAGPGVRVAELHERALTQPHPGGRDADWRASTPPDPAFVVPTVQRVDARASKYGSDRALLLSLRSPYRYLGRVEQHFHRYYDVYVRADVPVPDLPPGVIVNRAGLEPVPGPRPFPRLP